MIRGAQPVGGYRARVRDALLSAAEKSGYRIDYFSVAPVEPGRKLSQTLINRGIQGVILAESALVNGIPEFDWQPFSIVALQGETKVPFHQIQNDYFNIARLAVRRAVEAGQRRIGLILMTNHFGERDYPRLGGFLAEIHRAFPIQRPLVLTCPFTTSYQKIARWFVKHQPGTIIGSVEMIAERLMESGISIPEDCRFISLRETPESRWACIVRNNEELGEAVIALLDKEIKLNHTGIPQHPIRFTIEPEWRSGPSFPEPGSWHESPHSGG